MAEKRLRMLADAREERELRKQPALRHPGHRACARICTSTMKGVIQDRNWRRRLAKAKPGQRVFMHPLVSYKPKSREA